MPPNKKKSNKNKKNGGAKAAGDGDMNLNRQVLEALARLAHTLAQLDEACDHDDPRNEDEAQHDAIDGLADETAAMAINAADDDGPNNENAALASSATVEDDESKSTATTDAQCQSTSTPSSTTSLTPPALPISHWRTLPLTTTSAYKILNDGASYIHATSTKYTLVGKVDTTEGANLALELRKGAELIGTATLLFYSPNCGSSRSLRHYTKQSSRAVLASVIALIQSFDDGTSQGKAHDGNNVGAQKTGAVWSACDAMMQKLPRGNRAAMRRELMVWVMDCNESIEEFVEVLELGPSREEAGDEEEDEDVMMMMEEEQYSITEHSIAKACVNLMKCSKKLLALVLRACEDVGEVADKLALPMSSTTSDEEEEEGQSESKQTAEDAKKQKELLHYIANLHEMARTVGEGVTNVGILLYPPLDTASSNDDEYQKWQTTKRQSMLSCSTIDKKDAGIPSLGSSALGLQLEHQMYALLECIESVHNPPTAGEGVRECLSQEVVDGAERLVKALKVRCKEVEDGMSVWSGSGLDMSIG